MAKIHVQAVRGMHDILPQDQKYWQFLQDNFEKIAKSAGFSRISFPVVEKASLFERTVGEETDIVEKEMYSLVSRKQEEKEDKEILVLRPEGTASVARAYVEHGMQSLSQPVQLYYSGPMFRYGRPQKGRQRQFHQLGLEIIGDLDPVLDAQLISLASRLIKKLCIQNRV